MSTISMLNGLQDLWNETLGDPDICIAILDGPVDLAHACFSGAHIEEAETLAKSAVGNDPASQHGTHVASIVFGQHGSTVQGIAPRCRGIIVPIYSSNHGGKRMCSQLDLARAIDHAISHGAHIINISGGELSSSGVPDPLLESAIQRCADHGILVVAAVGNDGCRCLHVPASIASVLAVGAMNGDKQPLDFSNWGDLYQDNGILSLGVDIPGAAPGGGVAVRSGTSFAAPIISGVAALLLSLQIKHGIQPDGQRVRALLLESADACDSAASADCPRMLAGRLNITAAHAGLHASTGAGIAAQSLPDTTTRFLPLLETEDSNTPGIAVPRANREPPVSPHHSIDRRNMMIESENTSLASAFEAAISSDAAGERGDAAPAQISASAIDPSDCACSKNKAPPATAYVLGQIGYDFGTEAKRDAFAQLSGINVHDPRELLAYLQNDPVSAANLTWTLSLDATVVYAISPYGPFASYTYERLKEFLAAQIDGGVERVSIPGLISGSVRLMSGQEVPVLYPDLRGMYSWSTAELISAIAGAQPNDEKSLLKHRAKAEGVRNFLDRIYYEVRNLGVSAQDRAMNYAATNAFQISEVYGKAIQTDMKLDSINVERSPICRPGSDCWDVKLSFFNPAKRLEQARHVYRFTVDVSEVIPVTVGKVRDWDVY
jgi:cyanobactin maturation PatA/PatG family protease